jgi:hypothetical protein
MPIQDDDLISLQRVICLLLTDMCFAQKFAAWGILYTIGVENAQMSFNPNSVISLPHNPGTERPEIGTVKNDFSSDEMLRQIEALIALLLTTKNLSVGSVSGQLNNENAASGVAKLIDASTTNEDQNDQIAIFTEAEKKLWELFAHKMLPVWVQNGQIDPDYVQVFSDQFKLGISFPEIKEALGVAEIIDVEVKKLAESLTTKKEALKAINPELTDAEVDDFMVEINKEKLESAKFFDKNMPKDESQADPDFAQEDSEDPQDASK